MKTVAYFNQVEDNFVFSGDITDASKEVLEFIDVYDLQKLRKNNTRYVLMEIHSYNGHPFKKIESVCTGVLELTKKEAESNKNLYSSGVTQDFQILSDTQTTNTILIDFETNEYVWIDMNIPINDTFNHSEYTYNNRLNETILQFRMYKLLQLNAIAKGTQVFEKDDADVIFEKIDNDDPLPLSDILTNYI